METAGEVDFLYDANADQVQGFYFGRPLPAEKLTTDVLKKLRGAAAIPPDATMRLRSVSSPKEQ